MSSLRMKENGDQRTLSAREREIAAAYTNGANYREIAERLFIAPTTVRTHLSTIYRKLGVSTRIELLKVLQEPKSGTGFGKVEKSILPEIPSLTILPFESPAVDPALDVFSEGLTEEILAALSRVPDLKVFSGRTSANETRVPVRDPGVGYALRGSVRAIGNRIRITAQLTRRATGECLWSERYESVSPDVFQVQDDITRNIAIALQINLTYGELSRLWEGQTRDLRAWKKMVEGRKYFNLYSKSDMIRARVLFKEALELDPEYGGALLHLGLTHWWEARYALEVDVDHALTAAEQVVDQLTALGNQESAASYLRGYIQFIRRDYEASLMELTRASLLRPGDSWIKAVLGQVCIFAGQTRAGIGALKEAMRLSPYFPDWYPYNLALGYGWLRENEAEAVELASSYIQRIPTDPYGYTNLATVMLLLGHDASRPIKKLCTFYPNFCEANLRRSELYRDQRAFEELLFQMRRMGLRS